MKTNPWLRTSRSKPKSSFATDPPAWLGQRCCFHEARFSFLLGESAAAQGEIVHLDTDYRNFAKTLPFLILQNTGSKGGKMKEQPLGGAAPTLLGPQVPDFTRAAHSPSGGAGLANMKFRFGA